MASLRPSASFLKFLVLVLILSLGPGTIYFFYNRTGGLESRKEVVFHRNIKFLFMSGEESIELTSFTDWPWIRVCALNSGLTPADVETVIGHPYLNYRELRWLGRSDHWTLLFIDRERETTLSWRRPSVPIRMPKTEVADYYFEPDEKGWCVPRENARLLVSRRSVPFGITPIVVRLENLLATGS